VDAALVVARSDVAAAEGRIQEARSAHQQAVDELVTKQDLQRRNPGNVAFREIERLENAVRGRQGTIDAATAARQAAEAQISTLLPAQKASAEAALAQAETELAKSVIRAGVNGRVEQFALRAGDIVNPFMRPAGVLIPEGAGRQALIAGQIRGGELLIDPQQVMRPGTILVYLEPLYEGGLSGVMPGSTCIANAYTSNHDRIASGEVGTLKGLVLHAVDAVGIVHAMILRIQALVLPIQRLVFSGH
jgi:hypothetical protein